MSSDKRSVATDALETLGTLINQDCKRDAIHLAVEPCIAGEKLFAGMHIGIVAGNATSKAEKMLGIVDPFLTSPVSKGERFWLIVYPRQITSLRHVWSHPDFPEATDIKRPSNEQEASKQWIAAFAERLKQHPGSLMEAAELWVTTENDRYGGEYTYDNSETYKDYWQEFPEFWKHYEVVTGKSAKNKDSFFTCSC